MATNGVYIVMGEANCVVALLNKARRQYQLSQVPTLEDTDPLLRNFTDLKEVLNEVADLADMNPQTYLSPFLDVIKAQNTNGPITEAALAAVAKFLNYGLIDASSIKAANAVESIAYAVVHTKFIGGKSTGSDECVLFKILQVLRSLLLSPPGILLSNEAVCDMMQSCFRIVFEQNLSLLLRKAAESTLADMTQLIFTRLPTFVEDTRHPYIRQLVNPTEKRQKRKKKRQLSVHIETKAKEPENVPTEMTKLIGEAAETAETDGAANLGYDVVLTTDPPVDTVTHPDPPIEEIIKLAEPISAGDEADSESEGGGGEEHHERPPVRAHAGLQREIVSDEEEIDTEQTVGGEEKMPYGLPCCRELLRFLITMTNPVDRHNTESMVILGLNLLIVALEAIADFLPNYDILMPLIKNELCRNLLQLLDTNRLPVLAATNRCCFLLFESMRMHMKFQLESYLKKLQSIVLTEEKQHENGGGGTEQKEMALESLVQLWRIPGLVTEMYLNFDCDLYCGNIFEDLTKLLVENSFPTVGGHTASLLSLDALLVVIETIEQNCEDRENGRGEVAKEQEHKDLKKLGLPVLSGYDLAKKMAISTGGKASPMPVSSSIVLRSNRHAPSTELPSMSQIIEQKKRKRLIAEGTELFNQSPKKGIAFLREKGILGHDEQSLVQWLRTNPQLDKKAIADYICNRKHAEVLNAFVKSFPFENTRLDVALRMFLETFRLPGESAEIALVMQHFSEEWFRANNEPFFHVDAAFTLSYAIIMLNVDQHNPQAKRSQPPMTVDCFRRNLSGTNDSRDFDPEMLADMYQAIKTEEIVMPAEQKGTVKEDYMWKVLLRRGETAEGSFYHAPTGWNDHDLFAVCWGPAVAALSYVFDKSEHEQILQKALTGYRKCAKIAAYYGMKEVFDNLCIHLCKFTTLTSMRDGGAGGGADEDVDLSAAALLSHSSSPEAVALAFGENHKAQLATRTLFYLVHENGNILREGWRNLFEALLQLFRARLLPAELTEVEDYVDEKGWVNIQRVHQKELPHTRNDSGLLSWFGLGGGASEADRRKPTQEQLSSMKLASQVISECRPSQIVADSKYLTSTSLAELLSSIAANSAQIVEQAEPQQKTASLSGEDEDALVFYLELIVAITLENKDRLPLVWPHVRRHLEWLLSPRFGRCPVLVERAVVGLLRVANRNLFRDNTVSDDVLHSLSMLLRLSPKALFIFSRQIAFGLYELIRANAANVHKKEHWAVLFALLEAAGAAVLPDDYVMMTTTEKQQQSLRVGGDQQQQRMAYSDVEGASGRGGGAHEERAYTSEGEERRRGGYDSNSDLESRVDSAGSLLGAQKQPADWIHLDHKDAAKATEEALTALGANVVSSKKNFRQFGSLVLRNGLGRHEPAAFLKVCECLAFLLRDAVHVTPDNFESSLQCLRTMVEASLDGGVYAAGPLSGDAQNRLRSNVTDEKAVKKHHHHHHGHKKKELCTDVTEDADESRNEEQQLIGNYQQMSLHLLDLCSQLHSQTPAIFAKWAQGASPAASDLATVAFIWTDIWRPLLQAIGRLSCDCRRGVRAAALTHLQRAFLPANMATLGAAEWQSCFGEVLFPLLTKLLEPFSQMDPIGMEDTRVRTLQIVAKTLLNHLSALSALDSFPDLWMLLLDYMEQYLRVDSCGNLNEAVPESLKNMLLVMDSTGIFAATPRLYDVTVERLNKFMPELIKDTIPNPPRPGQQQSEASEPKKEHASGLEPPPPSSNSTAATSTSDPSIATAQSSISTASSVVGPLVTCPEDAGISAPIPIQHPLTEVIVHSGPTSPIGSPPQTEPPASSPPQHQHSEHQQYEQYRQQQAAAAQQYQQYNQNYPQQQQQQQQQYAYSPEHAAYYQQQYAHQQQQYAEHYANQYQHYQQQQQQQQQHPVNPTSPSVHGQYSVANPLPLPAHPAYHPIVAPSVNSAFTHVYTPPQNNAPALAPSAPTTTSADSPYFTPIPYNPSQQEKP
ncbi:Golgi-specific brefeldin A-resistance guanine nucleotide exchange factor 1 homolog [Caenorhabditis elegans]|uniref:Golgi-specific brefeldin A-resistance guanine nucleotide exchange factor 1 homolog n=2 Tax=Caenorhabditis elegans TaxID=6239 RepID=GBF1_CAEEL|nr:Golgi-specific brefeldin A-resistance guanine nucleotide exchange factor 1 homolog [Caenorhabditis elegans]G5EGS5.1 RecName: Full=Golgi-specific brefeldin A-resistance guanine nucleotide exchange factor 1 homolog; Short=BFA-resistant GEF 1 [Caenorhabditis elegans]CAB03915.3 Golgi-specific brefeldin A-resistance guanine nucleotide exchange factor 1 homolog [Caenorhabditis elegans]|eukprot:NP_001255140.1 Uncharacterized protein CELE_C24H11.7 [Caenorhabditis elegans]